MFLTRTNVSCPKHHQPAMLSAPCALCEVDAAKEIAGYPVRFTENGKKMRPDDPDTAVRPDDGSWSLIFGNYFDIPAPLKRARLG